MRFVDSQPGACDVIFTAESFLTFQGSDGALGCGFTVVIVFSCGGRFVIIDDIGVDGVEGLPREGVQFGDAHDVLTTSNPSQSGH
jgi:hypothetical protein